MSSINQLTDMYQAHKSCFRLELATAKPASCFKCGYVCSCIIHTVYYEHLGVLLFAVACLVRPDGLG